jgi:uncharacterized membrane protein YdjX (TVP38/TMEM64 family)
VKLALGAALGLAALAGAGAALAFPQATLEAGQRLADAARDAGPAGIALFALAQAAVALSGVLPAALLGVAAGAVYGLGLGFAVAAVATLAGAWAAFAVSRASFGAAARRFVERRAGAKRLDAAIARDGWRFVLLMRLSPVMPFAATSFALGLTRIGGRDYLLGTLGALPALFGYVAMGTLCQHGLMLATKGAGWWQYGGLAVGIAATAALTLRVGRLAAYSFSQT